MTFSSQVYSSWKEIQEEKYKIILQHFPEIFSGLILDIGSGKGYLEKSLAVNKIGANIVCIDIEKPANLLASGDELPFKADSFDNIISIDAIHLVKSLDFTRVLKKDGLVLFTLFFNQENYNSKKKLIEEKLSGFKILSSMTAKGKENEYMVLARK